MLSTTWQIASALLLLSLIAGYARAQSETRVDDDNSAIEYSPAGSWFRNTEVNELDAGGHHMVTEDTTATAVFRFIGTGIRYMSALYALEINTTVRLDGGAPFVINLQDLTVPVETAGPPTVPSIVLWQARGLANEEHTLEVGFSPGGLYAVVDMFIVETNGPTPATNTTTDTTPTTADEDTSSTALTSAPAGASTSTSPPPGETLNTTVIIAALACPVLGLLVLIALLLVSACRWLLRRKRDPWARDD